MYEASVYVTNVPYKLAADFSLYARLRLFVSATILISFGCIQLYRSGKKDFGC